MKYPLIQALVETIVFLGMSGDDAVNPDAAVGQLEEISTCLKELDGGERERFLATVSEMAIEAEGADGPTERSRFLRDIPKHLGLT
jgi:hypothetical protein